MEKSVNYNKFQYLYENTVIAEVRVKPDGVYFVNYANNAIDCPFGVAKSPVSKEDLVAFFKTRTIRETRTNLHDVLESGGFLYYDVSSLIKRNHGVMSDDCYWIRFDGENLTWKDVKHLRGV